MSIAATIDSIAAESIAARAAPSPQAGQLAAWRLVEQRGEGLYARVYRARPAAAHRSRAAYAIKLLKAEHETSSDAIGLLRREAMASRAVADRHIVSVLEASLAAPPYYLVMPWLEGATLDRRLATGWTPALPTALWIARQAAEGIDALDRAGWMHGDLRPAHFVVSPEGHVTLLGLQFARRQGETGSAVERPSGRRWNYLAPEWITSALRSDVRSDIFSLGAVLYEMLSGRAPYRAASLADLAGEHRTRQPAPIGLVAPTLPKDVADLVDEMISVAADRRPQTPAELIERLVRLEIAQFDQVLA